MEFIGLIIAYFVISFIWSAIQEGLQKKKLEGLLKEMAEERQQNIFTCKVTNDVIEGEDYDWDVFNIQMKGIVEGPHDNFSVKYIVRLYDITDGDETPVFSTYEDFQAGDSKVFFHESEISSLPYESTIYKDWSTVIKVPKLFLEYPRKGQRKLKFQVVVIEPIVRTIYAEGTATIVYNNTDNGYLDAADNREHFEEMLIKTALLVSASDGEMDAEEANVVKTWIKKRLTIYNDNYKDSEKERMNTYIKDAYQEIQNDDLDIYEVLEGIENVASEGEKFELFQICLDVAQADGEADDAELTIIHEIADYINLDRKQFKSMVEKTLPITMHTSEASDEDLLGIEYDMSVKAIKKILNEQYKKWSSRVTSSDPAIREQAESMIQKIAEARKRYIG